MKIMTPFFVKPYFDQGILFLRILTGGLMFYAHGWPKLANFGQRLHTFSDPLGLGSEITFLFAVFAEALCSTLVVIGLFTRLALIPLIITMLTAAFIVHADDPFRTVELPLLFAIAFVAILITGPGKLSIDGILSGKRRIRH
jgi:putative oxidoreductase